MKPIFLLKILVIKRIQRIRMIIEIINPHCVPEKSVENPVSYQQFEMFTFASY